MSTTIVSIVGTRNILFNKQVRSDYEDIVSEKKDFRVFTKKVLNNWATYSKGLEINILKPILKKYENKNPRLILVASDQKTLQKADSEHRIDQDTIYAAEILKRLVKVEYPAIEVEIWIQKVSVADPNRQLDWFFKQIRKVRENNNEVNLIAVDAGGTTQQKTAMKLAIEFLMPANTYLVYGVLRQMDFSSKLQLQQPVQYRSIITLEQIRQLVCVDQYEAALAMFAQLSYKESDRALISALLEHGRYRRKRQLVNARIELNRAVQAGLAKSGAIQLDFDRGTRYNSLWARILSKDDFIVLSEQLSIALRCHELSDLDGFVLGLSQFIELYSLRAIKHRLGYDFSSSIRRNKEIDRFNTEFREVATWNGSKLYFVALNHVGLKLNSEVLKVFSSLHSSYNWKQKESVKDNRTIDILRNRYVHEGRPVTVKELEKVKDLELSLKNLKSLFNINEISPYTNLSRIIHEAL